MVNILEFKEFIILDIIIKIPFQNSQNVLTLRSNLFAYPFKTINHELLYQQNTFRH